MMKDDTVAKGRMKWWEESNAAAAPAAALLWSKFQTVIMRQPLREKEEFIMEDTAMEGFNE